MKKIRSEKVKHNWKQCNSPDYEMLGWAAVSLVSVLLFATMNASQLQTKTDFISKCSPPI